MSSTHEDFMMRAFELAHRGIDNRLGGPFGCVVVAGDNVVGEGSNCVTSTNDPTAHAEIVAIRAACQNLETFQLGGCQIYTTCEPCPMCLGAIYWARPAAVFYAGTRADAAAAGFDDRLIYDEIEKPVDKRLIPMGRLLPERATELFDAWKLRSDKVEY